MAAAKARSRAAVRGSGAGAYVAGVAGSLFAASSIDAVAAALSESSDGISKWLSVTLAHSRHQQV